MIATPLRPFLDSGRVAWFPPGTTKPGCIERLARLALADQPDADADAFLVALREREEVASTGIGQGIAVPHAAAACLERCRISIGLCPTGIPFAAKDDQPVKIIVLIASIAHQRSAHLAVLAGVASRLQHAALRRDLITATDAATVLDLMA